MSKFSQVLTSRKFWATVTALILIFFGERAGITGEQLTSAVYALIAYILGQGLADIRARA
jgi:hypothetical protein